jgi:hypothetical protein
MKIIILFLGTAFALNSFAQTDSLAMNKMEVVLTGKTCGALPSLKYGPGTDRLGGAKMTYLDTAIVLQVVDSLKDDYIVRLSANHKAFIPKENIQFILEFKKPAYTLTSSWKVSGDEKQDYVSIGLDERLPYKSFQLQTPENCCRCGSRGCKQRGRRRENRSQRERLQPADCQTARKIFKTKRSGSIHGQEC